MGFNMKQLQQQMQQQMQKMQKLQDELANTTFEGTAGGGVVTLTLRGTYEVAGVKISPEAVDPEDVATLEDLIVAAARDAFEKVKVQQEKTFGPMLGGMKIPGF